MEGDRGYRNSGEESECEGCGDWRRQEWAALDSWAVAGTCTIVSGAAETRQAASLPNTLAFNGGWRTRLLKSRSSSNRSSNLSRFLVIPRSEGPGCSRHPCSAG